VPGSAGYLVACGPLLAARGAGSTTANRGGILAVDGDRGLIQPPPNSIERMLPACILEAYGATTLARRELQLGRTAQVDVSSLFARPYALVLAPTTTFLPGPAGDRLVFDALGGTAVLWGFGALSASGLASQTIAVPPLPALAGLQLTLQAALGPPAGGGGPALALTLPDFAVVTP
jgi:hypothetical protein